MKIKYIKNLSPDGPISVDPATEKILSRLKNAPKLGRIKGELRREELYEELADEHDSLDRGGGYGDDTSCA
jgi:hypothetical protein